MVVNAQSCSSRGPFLSAVAGAIYVAPDARGSTLRGVIGASGDWRIIKLMERVGRCLCGGRREQLAIEIPSLWGGVVVEIWVTTCPFL